MVARSSSPRRCWRYVPPPCHHTRALAKPQAQSSRAGSCAIRSPARPTSHVKKHTFSEKAAPALPSSLPPQPLHGVLQDCGELLARRLCDNTGIAESRWKTGPSLSEEGGWAASHFRACFKPFGPAAQLRQGQPQERVTSLGCELLPERADRLETALTSQGQSVCVLGHVSSVRAFL